MQESKKNFWTPRMMAMTAMLCAIAYVAVLVGRVPVILFLKYDPKDAIIALGGFIWGPLVSVVASVVVSFVEMLTISDNGLWGFFMNVASTCSFACVASFVYRRKRTLSGALLGLAVGSVSMVIVMLFWNYLITPIYMATPREKVAGMLLPVFLPFNLLKAGLNAGATYYLYKPVVTALRKAGLVDIQSEQVKKKPIWVYLAIYLAFALIMGTCIWFILSFNGVV
ncbi:MAG: ECF transporter S component [Oscillospiraceae bacterium]|nr:ECF transporter S component [Oscillospiraceae bacterium]